MSWRRGWEITARRGQTPPSLALRGGSLVSLQQTWPLAQHLQQPCSLTQLLPPSFPLCHTCPQNTACKWAGGSPVQPVSPPSAWADPRIPQPHSLPAQQRKLEASSHLPASPLPSPDEGQGQCPQTVNALQVMLGKRHSGSFPKYQPLHLSAIMVSPCTLDFNCLQSVGSVAQSCPTLCNLMDCSTPGFPVHHQLPESTQTHVHWVGDAIQPSHPLSPPSPPALNLSQHQGPFRWVSSLHQVAKVLEFQLQHQSFQRLFRTDFLSDWLDSHASLFSHLGAPVWGGGWFYVLFLDRAGSLLQHSVSSLWHVGSRSLTRDRTWALCLIWVWSFFLYKLFILL